MNLDIYFDKEAFEKLKELEIQTGAAIIKPLADLYIQTTKEELIKIKIDLKNNNRKEVLRRSHSLKSSSANVGAVKIRHLSESIENLLIDNPETDENSILIIIYEIETSIQATFKEIELYFQST